MDIRQELLDQGYIKSGGQYFLYEVINSRKVPVEQVYLEKDPDTGNHYIHHTKYFIYDTRGNVTTSYIDYPDYAQVVYSREKELQEQAAASQEKDVFATPQIPDTLGSVTSPTLDAALNSLKPSPGVVTQTDDVNLYTDNYNPPVGYTPVPEIQQTDQYALIFSWTVGKANITDETFQTIQEKINSAAYRWTGWAIDDIYMETPYSITILASKHGSIVIAALCTAIAAIIGAAIGIVSINWRAVRLSDNAITAQQTTNTNSAVQEILKDGTVTNEELELFKLMNESTDKINQSQSSTSPTSELKEYIFLGVGAFVLITLAQKG
jgi:hypothetical protein